MTDSPARGDARTGTTAGVVWRRIVIAAHMTGNCKFVKHRIISQATDGARFAIREWPGAARLGLHVFWYLVMVALLVYLGPFGTWASLTVSERVLFWTTTVGANWLAGYIVFTATIREFRTRQWPVSVGLVVAALVTALPGTATVWLVVAIYLDYRPSDVFGVIGLYTQVFVLHLMIGSLVHHLIERALWPRGSGAEGTPQLPDPRVDPPWPEESANAVSLDTQEPEEAALLARLSARSRAELLHLRMQDHYVEVHTAAGSELLLLRFRDALREVENVNGLQVHRSHWVARDAVAGVERRGGGRVILRLVNGSRVPVSRSFAPVLKAQGWI